MTTSSHNHYTTKDDRKAIEKALKAKVKAREKSIKARAKAAEAAIKADQIVRKSRMSGSERREQLILVAKTIFAKKTFDAVSIEEIATKASISKPVIYEHFGGKEELYAIIVDREVDLLLSSVSNSLKEGSPHELLAQAIQSFVDYVDNNPDGFLILVKEAPASNDSTSYYLLLDKIVNKTSKAISPELEKIGLEKKFASMYAQILVGMLTLVAQAWVKNKKEIEKEELASHLISFAWGGLSEIKFLL